MNTIEQHPFERLVLAPGATKEIASYFRERGIARAVLAGDRNTYEAAGEAIERTLRQAGVQVGLYLLAPGDAGDVVADEASIVRLLLEIEPGKTDMLIAAGAGTIHDIVRFAGCTTGTPLILRGVKKTVQATAPVAIFADTDILAKAPQPLIAAGFGDMIGKYTSLFDWKFSHLAAGEPYDESVASMTERALASCVEHVREIGDRTERGIRVLMAALIESGIAMQRFGRSHPASGAEHHLSHYWEMEYLRRGNRALLHGAKVGAACAEISRIYHDAAERGVYPGRQPEELRRYGGQIREWLAAVPREAQIRELLSEAGGPADRIQLGIDDELFARSLREAHRLRDRYTLLRALNEA